MDKGIVKDDECLLADTVLDIKAIDVKKGIPRDDDDVEILDIADPCVILTNDKASSGSRERVVTMFLMVICWLLFGVILFLVLGGSSYVNSTKDRVSAGMDFAVKLLPSEDIKQLLEEGKSEILDGNFTVKPDDSRARLQLLERVREHVTKEEGSVIWEENVFTKRDIINFWKLSMILDRIERRYKETNTEKGHNAELVENDFNFNFLIGG